MTTRDFALEIEPGASPERIHQIEQVLHKAIAEHLVLAAIEIDDQAREARIHHASQAAVICRRQAREHLNLT